MNDSQSIRKTIADRISTTRRARDLSQNELANRMGIHQTHVAHFESGRRMPNAKSLVALCGALGVTSDYLLGLSNQE